MGTAEAKTAETKAGRCTHRSGRCVWAGALIAFSHVLRDRLQRPSARRCLERVTGTGTGTVSAALGIRLALGR